MNFEKNFAPVTAQLDKFVKTFDEEYSCSFGSDFEAVNGLEIIYSIAVADDSATRFQNDFISRFPACADFDIFTLSFMHELGHCETDYDTRNDIKAREIIHAMKNKDKAYKIYFALHNEKIATDWAGEYLTAHHDDMKKWEKKILKTLKKVLDKYPD